MLPVQLLFLTITPVVEMRAKCRSNGEGYPLQVPLDIASILVFSVVCSPQSTFEYLSKTLLHNGEISITCSIFLWQVKWEFRGLDIKPTHLDFSARGVIYPDRRQSQHRLKGHLEMDISYSLPQALWFIPEDLLSNIFEEVRVE